MTIWLMRKRNIITIIALFAALYVFAQEFESDGIRYYITSIQDKTASISYGEHSGNLTIPSKVSYNEIEYDVTVIDFEAFRDCINLTSVTIPEGVLYIGEYAFYGCSNLKSISIPKSVMEIGWAAFSGCSSLTSITIPDNATIYGLDLSGCSSLTTITIPESVTVLFGFDLSGCSNLTSFSIPEGMTYIKEEAFKNCSSLKSIIIPESVDIIYYGAFSGCSGLTSITIPNSVTTIQQSTFSGCNNVITLSIPESVTCIGQGAFNNCDSLKSVYCYIKTPINYDNAFYLKTYSTATLYVPNESVEAYRNSDGWNNFQNIQSFTTTDIEMIPYESEADRVANTSVPIIKMIENGKLIITMPDGSKFNAVGIKVE